MKYDLKAIMQEAWTMVKGFGWSLSQALKQAWADFKAGNTLGLSAEAIALVADVYNNGMKKVWFNFGGFFKGSSSNLSFELDFLCNKAGGDKATIQVEGIRFTVTRCGSGRSYPIWVSVDQDSLTNAQWEQAGCPC